MEEIKSFFTSRKNLVNLVILLILVIGLPIALKLAKDQQLLRSQAAVEPIAFAGDCVIEKNGKKVLICTDVTLKLTSTLGPPVGASGSATATPSATPVPTASSSATPSPLTCNPKKFDVLTWESTREACIKGKQKIIYSCGNKTRTDKKNCLSSSGNYNFLQKISEFLELNVNAQTRPNAAEGNPDPNDNPPGGDDGPDSETAQTDDDNIDPGGDGKNCNPNKFNKKTWKKVSKVCLQDKKGKAQQTWECQGKTHLRIVRDKSCKVTDKNNVTISYKVSEEPNKLKKAPENPYDAEPKSHPFKFADSKPGKKTVFVEFIGRDSKGKEKKDRQSASIELLADNPQINNITCQNSFTGAGVILTIKGLHFGSGKGQIIASSTILSHLSSNITDWSDTQVLVSLSDATCSDIIFITLIRIDNAEAKGTYGPSPISLGAKLFCRKSAVGDVSNVEMILVGDNYPKTTSTVTITRDGLIQGLIDKLMPDKRYMVSFKAPKSVRRTSNPFFFKGGTTQLILRKQETELDKKYYFNVLPIGDIFPDSGDGSINGFDKTTLNGQWGIASNSAQIKTGDFNSDGVVNSVDWACMRYDFGENDDPEPSLNACSAAPSCTGQLITGDPSPTDENQCPIYQCNATQTATPSSAPVGSVAGCIEDARICDDGTTVVRIGPSCEFAPCPSPTPSPSPTEPPTPSPSPTP